MLLGRHEVFCFRIDGVHGRSDWIFGRLDFAVLGFPGFKTVLHEALALSLVYTCGSGIRLAFLALRILVTESKFLLLGILA